LESNPDIGKELEEISLIFKNKAVVSISNILSKYCIEKNFNNKEEMFEFGSLLQFLYIKKNHYTNKKIFITE
jgi:hypothetical protein